MYWGVGANRETLRLCRGSQRRPETWRKMDSPKGHIDGHREKRDFMVDRRGVQGLPVNANNDRTCEADHGDVLRFVEKRVAEVTH
jgi:hypothetical protein